jgi:hypothetical protein
VLGSPASILGSELTVQLGSGPLSWIETFVTFCGMVGLQAMVLGRLGKKTPLIQERVLYPSHRHLRAGVLRGSGLYNAPPGRAGFSPLCLARPSLCPSDTLSPLLTALSVWVLVSAYTST